MRRVTALLVLVAMVMATAPPVAQAAPKLLELDFRDAPLSAVLQTLARASGVNLLVEGAVTGTVTLHLAGTTFEQALRLMAAVYRLSYTVRDGAYIVRQLPAPAGGVILPQGAQSTPIELRAYPLRHARAEDVAAAISQAVKAFAQAGSAAPGMNAESPGSAATSPGPGSPGAPAAPGTQPGLTAPPGSQGSPQVPPSSQPGQTAPQPPAASAGPFTVVVVAEEASNSVLVAAPIIVQLQVQAVLRAIDVPGRALASPAAVPGAAPPAGSPPAAVGEAVNPNTVSYTIQYADPDQLAKILAAEVADIKVTVDARTRKLVVTGSARKQEAAARLIALLDQAIPQVMIATQVVELSETASRQMGIQWTWTPTITITQTPGGIAVGGSPLLDMVGQITGFVEQGEGKVLANPQIATQDGKKALINVGQILYVPITTVTEGVTTTQVQQINAGIKLEVTPRILDRKRLIADLNIEVNSLAGFGVQGFPIINSRTVTTIVEVADGTPIIIGGLISDTTTELLRKLPLLGDLPLIGEFFRYRERTRNYSNIVVTIIPRVLMPAGQ